MKCAYVNAPGWLSKPTSGGGARNLSWYPNASHDSCALDVPIACQKPRRFGRAYREVLGFTRNGLSALRRIPSAIRRDNSFVNESFFPSDGARGAACSSARNSCDGGAGQSADDNGQACTGWPFFLQKSHTSRDASTKVVGKIRFSTDNGTPVYSHTGSDACFKRNARNCSRGGGTTAGAGVGACATDAGAGGARDGAIGARVGAAVPSVGAACANVGAAVP